MHTCLHNVELKEFSETYPVFTCYRFWKILVLLLCLHLENKLVVDHKLDLISFGLSNNSKNFSREIVLRSKLFRLRRHAQNVTSVFTYEYGSQWLTSSLPGGSPLLHQGPVSPLNLELTSRASLVS